MRGGRRRQRDNGKYASVMRAMTGSMSGSAQGHQKQQAAITWMAKWPPRPGMGQQSARNTRPTMGWLAWPTRRCVQPPQYTQSKAATRAVLHFKRPGIRWMRCWFYQVVQRAPTAVWARSTTSQRSSMAYFAGTTNISHHKRIL